MRVSVQAGTFDPASDGGHSSPNRKEWRILVAVDGSAVGERALDWSLDLAERAQGTLTAVILQGRLPSNPTSVAEVNEQLAREQQQFDAVGLRARDRGEEHSLAMDVQFRYGPLGRVLRRETAARQFDLVVVGQRGRLGALLRAESTAGLVRQLPCPVLVVK